LLPCGVDTKPLRAVDFRKALSSTASGRPFDVEGIAGQRRRVKMALAGECDDTLAPSLSDLSERLQRTNRGAEAEFLLKLASGSLLWIIRGIDFALRNGPCATVLLAPERTAGVDEQHLEPAGTFAVGQNARAQHRSSGRLFLRSHMAPFCGANR